MSDPNMSPCVPVLQVLESSADTCSQNILALGWSNTKGKNHPPPRFLQQILGPMLSILNLQHHLLRACCTPKQMHWALPRGSPWALAGHSQSWLKKKIVTEAVFHLKGTFQGKMFLGNMWRWVNLWLKNVRLLQQQENLTLFQVFSIFSLTACFCPVYIYIWA